MMRCHVPAEAWKQTPLLLAEDESHHLGHVLRLRPGQSVEIFDGQGRVAAAVFQGLQGRRAILEVGEIRQVARGQPQLILAPALLREQRMDWIIQKAVELGADALWPFEAEHAVAHIAAERRAEKQERWRRILRAAAKQSGWPFLPDIAGPGSLADTLARAQDCQAVCLMGSLEPAAPSLPQLLEALRPPAVVVFTGPEGDFSAAEYALLRARGVRAVSFGPQVLRAETAAIFALCTLHYEFRLRRAAGGAP